MLLARTETVDLTIIVVYLMGIMAIGIWAGYRHFPFTFNFAKFLRYRFVI